MTRPVVAGIDSAERTGVVILGGEKIARRGICDVRSWVDVERAADAIAAFSPDLVAVEAPFVRINAATGLTLARLLGRWLQAFERRGITSTTVLASTWQPIVLAGRMTTRTPGPERKLAAIAWAQETFGIALPPDEADAAGIAWWAAKHSLTVPSGVISRPSSPPAPGSDAVRNCPESGGSP